MRPRPHPPAPTRHLVCGLLCARVGACVCAFRYFGTCTGQNDSSTFSADYRAFLRNCAAAQQAAYAGSRGWFFWTAKTEQSPQWDYLRGLAEGYIPPILAGTSPSFC